MKKLLACVCTLALISGIAASAATSEPTTFTERFIKRKTQKIVDKEKAITKDVNAIKAKQKAEKAALKKKQAEQKAKLKQKQNAINTLKSW
jgi:hypothetical protein